MFAPLRILLIVLLMSPVFVTHAQDKDYLKHGKDFCLCTYKRVCYDCWECSKDRYELKFHNKSDKKVKKISYMFYSEVYNKILEKDAKIQGNVIDRNHIALVYICLPQGEHWIISEVEYTDGTKNTYRIKERMENFIQEPDECDCNE